MSSLFFLMNLRNNYEFSTGFNDWSADQGSRLIESLRQSSRCIMDCAKKTTGTIFVNEFLVRYRLCFSQKKRGVDDNYEENLSINRIDAGRTHIRRLVGPLEGPGVGHGGVLGHGVRVGLPRFGSFPRLHHGGALPVHVLQRAHRPSFVAFIQ